VRSRRPCHRYFAFLPGWNQGSRGNAAGAPGAVPWWSVLRLPSVLTLRIYPPHSIMQGRLSGCCWERDISHPTGQTGDWLVGDEISRDPVLIRKSLIEFTMKIDPRFFRKSFWSGSWSRLQSGNRWSFSKWKTLIDFDLKIADRFAYENRSPIYRSDCGNAMWTVF